MKKKALVVGPQPWAGALAVELGRLGADVTVAAQVPAPDELAALAPDVVVASAAVGKDVWLFAQRLKRAPARSPVLVLVGPRDMDGTFRKHAQLKIRADAYVPDDRDVAELAKLAMAVEPGRVKPAPEPWGWAWLGLLAAPAVWVLALPAAVEWAILAVGMGLVLVAARMGRRAPTPWS